MESRKTGRAAPLRCGPAMAAAAIAGIAALLVTPSRASAVYDVHLPDGGASPLTLPRPKVADANDFPWPVELRGVHLRGLAILQCDIAIDGGARNCRLLKGVSPLDGGAIAAYADALAFEPAHLADGTAAPFSNLVVSLELKTPRAAADGGCYEATGTNDDPLCGDPSITKPKLDLERSPQFPWPPELLRQHVKELVLVQGVLTREGRMRNCRILKHGEKVSDELVIGYVNQLLFDPARRPDGGPVALESFTVPLRIESRY